MSGTKRLIWCLGAVLVLSEAQSSRDVLRAATPDFESFGSSPATVFDAAAEPPVFMNSGLSVADGESPPSGSSSLAGSGEALSPLEGDPPAGNFAAMTPDPYSPQTSGSNWGAIPRLPGLSGVRGLTGVIGNLMQTNPQVGATFYPTETVSNQPGASLGMQREYFQLSVPVFSNGVDSVMFSSHVQSTMFQTNAILPTTHDPFPNQLWNIWLGATYFHQFDNKMVGALIVESGSASNQPFDRFRDVSASGTGMLIIPQGERDSWIAGLQASTNSQVLYNIPIPGAAYLYNPNDDFQAIVGFPYTALNYRPKRDLQLQLLYMFVTTVHARASYQICKDAQTYIGFDWTNENYARADRPTANDRFYYYEKRVLVGWQWWFSQHIALELAGGYAFDRYFFETQNGFQLTGGNRINVGSGPFVTVQLDARF